MSYPLTPYDEDPPEWFINTAVVLAILALLYMMTL